MYMCYLCNPGAFRGLSANGYTVKLAYKDHHWDPKMSLYPSVRYTPVCSNTKDTSGLGCK